MSNNNKTSFFRVLLNTIYNGAVALESASESLAKGAGSLNEMAEVAHQKSAAYAAAHAEMAEKERKANIAELRLKHAKKRLDIAKEKQALELELLLEKQNPIDGEVIAKDQHRPLAIKQD